MCGTTKKGTVRVPSLCMWCHVHGKGFRYCAAPRETGKDRFPLLCGTKKQKSKPPLCAATWDGKGSPLTCGAMRDRKKSISAPVWCHVGPERCGFRFCVVPRVTGNGFTARVHGPTRDQKEPIFAPVCTPWRHAGTERLSLRSSLCDAKRERKKVYFCFCVPPRGTGKVWFPSLCGAMQNGKRFPLLCGATWDRKA